MTNDISSPAPTAARPRRRGLLGAAAVLGLLLAATTAALPASAHDELVASTPAADAALDPAPAEVVLTFSDNILEVGVEVTVTDDAGADWVAEAPVIDGPDVTTALASDMPGGAYTVSWRVVSSDGHPISGTIPFTVTTPAATETATPADEPTTPAVAAPTDSMTQAPSIDPETEPTSGDALSGAHVVILVGIALAVLVIITAVLLLLARRRNAVDADRAADDAGVRPEDR